MGFARHRQFVSLLQLALVVTVMLLTPRRSRAADPPVTAVAFTPDGKSILAGSQTGLRRLSWPDQKAESAPKSSLTQIHALTFSPGGDSLAVAGGSPGESGIVEVFAWPSGKLRFRIDSHTDVVYAVAWSPSGKQLATAAYDRTTQLVDAGDGKRLHQLTGHSRGVLAVAFLPGGESLVSAGVDQSLRVWEASTGRAVRSLENHTAAVNDLAARPVRADEAVRPTSPPLLASVSDDRTVRLWQPTIGRLVRFARLTSQPVAAAWSPDGGRLAVVCRDGRVRVLDPDTLQVLRDLRAVDGRAYSLAFHPTGTAVAVGATAGQIIRLEVK